MHMVTHDEAATRHRISFLGRGERRAVSWLAAVVVPSIAAALMG